jgi:3-oxoacyl-[acyl-carrier protein] reductase
MSENNSARVAFISGAARGIGFAIAEELSLSGYSIIISDILADKAKESAEILSRKGTQSLAVSGDVSKPQDVDRMFDESINKFGKVDILVNNAGVTRDNFMLRMEEKDWDLVLNINLKGAFLCTKSASKIMMKNRWGRIINISSVVGVMGNAGQANYAASKAGLIGFTKSAAKELASRNITVNAVAPGYIQTEMTEKLPEAAKEGFLSVIPLKRAGTPLDVARVVSFLASDNAEYITGQVIHCDGGMVM